MKKLDPLWQEVIDSPTAAEESRAVGRLRAQLAAGGIQFETTLVNPQGKEIAYDELSSDFQIETARIRFFKDGDAFEGRPWKPKDVDNVFRLYQE
jgi:hypothetical protein